MQCQPRPMHTSRSFHDTKSVTGPWPQLLLQLLLLRLLVATATVSQLVGGCGNNYYGTNCSLECHCLPDGVCLSNGFCTTGCDPNYGGTSCVVVLPRLNSTPSVTVLNCTLLQVTWSLWSPVNDTGSGYPNNPFNVSSYTVEQYINGSYVSNLTTSGASPLYYVVSMYDYMSYRVVSNWDDYGKETPGLPSNASANVRPADVCTASNVTSTVTTALSSTSVFVSSTTILSSTTTASSVSITTPTTTVTTTVTTSVTTSTPQSNVPTSVTATGRNMTCIDIAWTPPPAASQGQIVDYLVNVTPVSQPDLSSINITTSNVSRTVVCNLAAGVQYQISVSASIETNLTGQGVSWGPPSATLSIWTEICQPAAPFPPTVNSTGIGEITVVLKPMPALACAPVTAYYVVVTSVPDTSLSSTSPGGGRRRRRSENDALSQLTRIRIQLSLQLPNPVQFIPLPGGTTVAQLDPVNIASSRGTLFTVGDGQTYNGYQNTALLSTQNYTVYFVAASSLNGVTKMAYSQTTSPVSPQSAPSGTGSDTGLSETGRILIAVFVTLLLLVLLALLIYFFCCRERCKQQNQERASFPPYLWNSTYDPKALSLTIEVADDKKVKMRPANEQKWSMTSSVEEPRHIILDPYYDDDELSGTSPVKKTLSFQEEYQKLPEGMTCTTDAALRPENAGLNRFPHLLAYDHSRVVLDRSDADDNPDAAGTDYINANYLPGYDRRRKAYIAAQSPFNRQTICDFWLMVYQERVSQIVLLTNFVDDGVVKCEQYWVDDESTHRYGCVDVTLQRRTTFANFVVREFRLERVGVILDGNSHLVIQYHFLDWPDHGKPGNPLSLLEFHEKIRTTSSASFEVDPEVPLLVHCGTGTSRTGVFIAIDYLTMQAKKEKCINVYKFCATMRSCRPMMVRTFSQYKFIYDVMFESLMTSHTTVGRDVRSHYRLLNRINDPRTNHSYFQEHFKLLETHTELPTYDDCTLGLSDENRDKNRLTTLPLVPRDLDRPVLTSRLSTTNYINAVYIDSYLRKKAFIVTQTPLNHTVGDFWALVYDFKVSCIVTMNGSDETNASVYPQNDGETIQAQNGFDITLLRTTATDHVTIRRLQLANHLLPNKPRIVNQFQFRSWKTTNEVPSSREALLELLESVRDQTMSLTDAEDGFAPPAPPIVVHCQNGAMCSGLFCASWIVCEKMRLENQVNLFHAVKALKAKRHGIISSLEQYKFMLKLLYVYCTRQQLPSSQ